MAVATRASAARLPGPPEFLPGRPDAIVDLQSADGLALVGGEWRYSDARVEEIDFVAIGSPEDPLGPGSEPNRTYDVLPHAEAPDFDDSGWRMLAAEETQARLADGRVCFNWYRVAVTIPERIGELDPTGASVVFEVVIDDYAEVWVNGELPHALGDAGGPVVAGFNAPNRVLLTRDARPGETFQIAVFGINGPISASPRNYIWMRTATLDFYASGRASSVERIDERVERVAGGFDLPAGPAWSRGDGALLFSSRETGTIYRYDPGTERITVFRSKLGADGLAFSPDGLLTICQHEDHRVIRVNPHGDVTVLCDSFEGRRLESPHDLVYRSDGTLYFTDPAGALAVRPDGSVVRVADGLDGPSGIALSPDERWLYVGGWRYPIAADGSAAGPGELLRDLAGEPDGIEVHPDGRLIVCGPGGISVLSPQGDELELIELSEAPTDLTFGPDADTLYVTGQTSIYRLRLEANA